MTLSVYISCLVLTSVLYIIGDVIINLKYSK